MQAAIITGRGRVELQEFPEPEPAVEGVVVDVRYCGICGTDVHAYQSGDPYPPALCGHEWTGAVSKLGAGVSDLREGDRVTVAIKPPCGACLECRAGHEDNCRRALNAQGGGDRCGSDHGGFAPSIAVSADRVARVPAGLSDEAAAQVEPVTVAYHAVRRSGLRLGDRVLVQGAGPIGLYTLQWVRAAGAAEVFVVESSPARQQLAQELGATQVFAPGEEARQAVLDRTEGLGIDTVFECVGRPETLQTAADFARTGASLMVIGLSDLDAPVKPSVWLRKELTVACSMGYHHTEFERAMAMMAEGRVIADPLHSRTVGMTGIEAAISELAAGPSQDVKILLDPRA
ncbi:zinc-binding dehydrogenase [Myxococcota bacterium]|nr:zinc-binding dehydrogenase [Myxococcota bacterium]